MVHMLLLGESAAVSFNGLNTGNFSIRFGVRQGCPLAPDLFLLVASSCDCLSTHVGDWMALEHLAF